VQRTIRFLRVALPLAFFGFILLIVLSWHRGKPHKDKSGAVPVTSTMRPVDKPQVESTTFEDTQTIAGRVAMHVKATRLVAFTSGWNTLEDVQLTIYRPTGLTYELHCPQAQFNSNTKEAEVKGGAKLTSTDGLEITSAEMHYDGSHLTNHIPVQFKIDRWTGRAGALDLDIENEMLKLTDDIDATLQPAHPGESAMRLLSHEVVYRRKENNFDFTSKVVMTRDLDRLNADHVMGRFTADRQNLMALEGQGNVLISMGGNDGGVPAKPGAISVTGRKDITCDRFFSDMGPNGQISALTAVGDAAPVHAVLEGPEKRDLLAKTLRVGLANKLVTDLKADGSVIMHETAPIAREMTSEHMTVNFDASSHRATSAALIDNFKYKDPRNQASAVRANYDIANDHVVLSADPGFNPPVVTDGQILKASVIEFSPRAGTAKASGAVIAQLISNKNGPSADSTNIFPAGKPVFVNADAVTMRQSDKLAVFTGNVRAWQDTNTMFAQEMQVLGAGEQITARGNVRTFLYNASTAAPGKEAPAEARKSPMTSKSEQLLARKSDRRIDLSGGVQINDDQRQLNSEKASFYFDAGHRIDKVESQTNLVLVESATGKKATGDKATYLVAQRMIYVDGSPATFTAPTGTMSGQQIQMDLARNKVEIVSPTGPTKATHKQ
jgi:Uncharacterized protein conserved in bacteria